MNTVESLNWRYATKEFDTSKKLSKEQLNIITESLMLTPSSFGLQPWKFIIIDDEELKKKLLPHSWNQSQITDCSHLIVLCSKNKVSDEDINKLIEATAKAKGVEPKDLDGYKEIMQGSIAKRSPEEIKIWANNQVYIALGNLLTVCAINNIDACPMEGFVNSKYDEILNLKEEGISSTVVCAVGFRSEGDKYATQKKVRFSKEDLIIEK